MLGRIILPQIASPALARNDSVNEHNLDHVDKFDPLGYHVLDARLEPSQLVLPQVRPFSSQEVSRIGSPDRNSGAAAQLVSRGSVM